MAAGDSTDLMMKFVKDGNPIKGESTTELVSSEGKSNTLLKGFDPGFYSEIDRFTMKAGIRDDDGNGDAPSARGTGQHAALDLAQSRPVTRTTTGPGGVTTTTTVQPRPTASLASTVKRGGYQSWRNGRPHLYPVDLQPISFTRVIDKTSAVLIQSCIDCTSFDSISLIKRKSSGIASASGEVASGEVFLRLDFVGCLVIKVDWDNDDKVSETVDFICRSVSISYRPQLPDGGLGRIRPGFWSMVPGETQQPVS